MQDQVDFLSGTVHGYCNLVKEITELKKKRKMRLEKERTNGPVKLKDFVNLNIGSAPGWAYNRAVNQIKTNDRNVVSLKTVTERRDQLLE